MFSASSVYEPRLEEIKRIITSNFRVRDLYYDAGVLTFDIEDTWIKERFKEAALMMRELGYLPTAKKTEQGVQIKVYPYSRPKKGSMRIPILMMTATIATVGADGYLRSSSPIYKLLQIQYGISEIIIQSLLFTIAIFSIVFIHEMGHKISAWIDKISASPPYFIPGLPGFIPTFGAVIFQRDPLVNRDDMFDIGVSGPVAGFMVGVLVTFLAFQTAVWIPAEQYLTVISSAVEEGAVFYSPPLIFHLIRMLYGNPDSVPFFMSVGFAAWLGMVVTALNLLPIWQLDGGRIFRSFLSRRQHIIASYIALGILAITGYFFMALLIILLMHRAPDIAPLDEVSPLSRGRKLAMIGVIAMLILSYVPLTRVA